jgi:proto-oncogene serine/threonine-protein kinase mos
MLNSKRFLEQRSQSEGLWETKKVNIQPFVQEIEMLSEDENSLLHVGKILGSGGFGCVYEGHYRERQVAIKKFHINSKSRRAMLQSFEAETSIMSFCHPNIIRTLAAYGTELPLGCRIIVMEFAGHKTLRNIIDDEKDIIID